MIAWSAKQRALQAAILDDAVDIGTPVIAPGPVQSGKSVAAFYGWLAWAAMSYAGHDFGLASRSQRQFEAVSLKYVQEFARTSGLGFYRRADHWEMGSTYGPAPNRFYAFIGNDRASEGKARGPSFAGVLFDEVTLMPPDFVDTLLDRCSVPGAKAVMTCNPGGPMHWVKTTYLDEAGQAVHLPFELSDNPSLSQAYIDGLMQRYSGAMLRRMVFGEWAATEGVIYPNTGKVVGDHPPLHTAWRFDLAADYADSSVTHALLMASYPDGARWAVAEWRYNGHEEGHLDESEQAERIARDLVGDRSLGRVVVDPAALGFRKALGEALQQPILPAATDVLPGIQKTRELMAEGTLRISHDCKHLVREMHNYRWDERAGLFGEDRPIKEDDHGPDALRYDVWTGRHPGRARVRRIHAAQ